jgi:hypothetical protein
MMVNLRAVFTLVSFASWPLKTMETRSSADQVHQRLSAEEVAKEAMRLNAFRMSPTAAGY